MAMLTDLSSLSSVNVKEKAAEASGGDYSHRMMAIMRPKTEAEN
jgi:hypothetical protein